MLGSSTSLTFQEISLTEPTCAVSFIAGAWVCGFQLYQCPDGTPNHQDVLIGPLHIQDFRKAQRKDLRRESTFRFKTGTQAVNDETLDIHGFRERWFSDPSLRRHCEAHPRYLEACYHLHQQFGQTPRSILAAAPGEHERRLIIPQHGDPALIALLADPYESGF